MILSLKSISINPNKSSNMLSGSSPTVILGYVMLCYVMLCYVMLCYAISCNVM